MTDQSDFGFRVTESAYEKRKLINWPTAFAAYADCDERANVNQQAFLSAFTFPSEFRDHLKENGSTRGYDGRCSSRYLWFDIDNEDAPEVALEDARRLASFLLERYALDDEMLLVWFSGGKGYHVALPTSLWEPESSVTFNKSCRKLAENLAGQCDVTIDSSVYDKVRLFRAPNSKHPKTGLFKRPISMDGLFQLDSEAIRSLAAFPMPFVIPVDPPVNEQALADWAAATESVTANVVVQPTEVTRDRLNRSTREFIQHGADVGGRARLLYSAARNLGEFSCSFELAFALLEPAARESGLPPSEIRRQVECGLADQAQKGGAS